jgi:hypothetical protein
MRISYDLYYDLYTSTLYLEWANLMEVMACVQQDLWYGGTMLQAGRSRDRVPMVWTFSNLPNPSGHTMALGSTQPLTEMSTRNLPGGKGQLVHRADNPTAICEPTV